MRLKSAAGQLYRHHLEQTPHTALQHSESNASKQPANIKTRPLSDAGVSDVGRNLNANWLFSLDMASCEKHSFESKERKR